MLSQTKINPELRESRETTPASPSSQSGQSLLLHSSPMEVKASVRSSLSVQQSRPVLSGSPSVQQSRPVLSTSPSEQQSRPVLSVSQSEQQSRTALSVSQSEQQPPKPEEPAPPSLPSPVIRKFSITTNWCFAAISLLLICAILLSMVIIMGSQVTKLSKISKEQTHLMHLHILILTETLRQLQTGQDHTCSVCKIKWKQRAEHCFLFSVKRMAWRWSNSFCKDKTSTLATVDTQEEMDFLKRESNKYFDLLYGQYQYYKFWIGLIYDPGLEKWIWANGTPSEFKLQAELDQKGCVYLQNGRFHSQDCHEVACFICKTKVQFGWS